MVYVIRYWKEILIGLVIVAAFIAGWRVCAWRYDSAIVGELKQQIQDYKALDEKRLDAAGKLEKELEEARKNSEIRYVERKKIIDRPVYRDCRIDDDGLRLLHEREGQINTARQYAYPSRGSSAP